MSNNPWLLIDGNYLCHRAHYTTGSGNLTHRGKPTGVIYGVLRDLKILMDRFNTRNIIFCFDDGLSFRRGIYAKYKTSRETKRKEEQKDPTKKKFMEDLHYQIEALKVNVLFQAGCRNVIYKTSIEADDWIAYLCKTDSMGIRGSKKIIVSADRDLLQLLDNTTEMYVPGKDQNYTRKNLETELFIPADGINYYWKIKALAGCSTDDVPGIDGVGEITAAKYLSNQLGDTTKAYEKIRKHGPKFLEKNKNLVKLPPPNNVSPLKDVDIQLFPNKFTKKSWHSVCEQFGLVSLLDVENSFASVPGIKKKESDGKRKIKRK